MVTDRCLSVRTANDLAMRLIRGNAESPHAPKLSVTIGTREKADGLGSALIFPAYALTLIVSYWVAAPPGFAAAL